MRYEVRALRDNQVVSLAVDAASEAEARNQARGQALRPLSVSVQGQRLSRAGGGFSLLLFSQELLALIEAGLSVVEAVDTLLDKETHASPRAIYARIRQSLGEGKRLSDALDSTGGIFPPLYVGIIQAAEYTSNLPEALARYIEYQSRLDAIRGKIISASVYPLILSVVGGAVIAFLVGYVVPRFASVYQGSGRQLPAVSAWLLKLSNGLTDHGGIALLLLAAVAIALVMGWRMLARQGGLAALLDHIPLLAPRVRLYELSRLYLTLGMLIDGGLPVVTALGMAQAMLRPGMRAALADATSDIRTGTSFAVAFERHGLTTPVSARFLRVGERSSKLGEMLGRSARYYDGEIARWIDWITKAFEPLLMAFIGLVVGIIVVLLYMPIFDLAGNFQ